MPTVTPLGTPTLSPDETPQDVQDPESTDLSAYGVATFSTAADAAAIDVAEQFWEILTDTSLTVADWHAQLELIVTVDEFHDLGGCDGCGDVDATWFTLGLQEGDATVERSPSPYLSYVHVPLHDREVTIVVTRDSDDDPWRVASWR